MSCLHPAEVAFARDKVVPIGVLAQRGAELGLAMGRPTAEYLSTRIPNHQFTLIPLSFDELFPAVENGVVDFVLTNPAIYVEMEYLYGLNRLATLRSLRQGEELTEFAGVIFCRRDRDDIHDLDDLRGKSFMAVDRESFGGFMMAWRELEQRGISPLRDFDSLEMGGTQDAVVQAVAEGRVDAGTVRTDTLEQMAAEGKIDLNMFRVLNLQQQEVPFVYTLSPDGAGVQGTRTGSAGERAPGGLGRQQEVNLKNTKAFPFLRSTRLYPEWPLATQPYVTEELVRKVALALLEMRTDDAAGIAGGSTVWALPHNYQRVHEALKELRVGPYSDFGEITLGGIFEQYWHLLSLALLVSVLGASISVHLIRLNRCLRESTAELESARRDLERRVMERTAELQSANSRLTLEVAERKQAQRALASEHAFLQTIIDGVVNPVMVIGLDHRIMLMNEAAREHVPRSLGCSDSLFCHQVSHLSDSPCGGEDHLCPLDEVRKTGNSATLIHRHFRPYGEVRIVELEASPLRDQSGQLLGIIETSRDITERLLMESVLRDKETQLRYLEHHDPLTDLPNRAMMREHLRLAVARSRRSGGSMALLFLNLDRLKKINDSFGYATGDLVLREVAKRLKSCIRESDVLARVGGDEFVLFLDGIDAPKEAAWVAQKILDAVAKEVEVEGHRLVVTASVGISMYPADAQGKEGLSKCANAAMTRAKEFGKNCYRFYTPDMNGCTRDMLLLEESLRCAMTNDELEIYYQPQVDLATGRLIGMEALLRWNHPERGMVSPGDFIPLAEETGLIVPMGEWILDTACRQNRLWQEMSSTALRVAVNISARQFRGEDLVATVSRALERSGLEPQHLELEITESMVMDDVEQAIRTLEELNRLGVHLAIDDFGTGYSSLSYLKRFPINRLKIDRSFVRDVVESSNDAAIATSVMALAHSMNLQVVAEGIETKAQLEWLRERGCETGQGFYLGRPLPAGQFATLLMNSPTGSPVLSGDRV